MVRLSKNKRIATLVLLGLILRLMLSPFGTLPLDFNTFLAWSNMLVSGGFANFYSGWSDYLPGYLYVLYFLGLVKSWLSVSGHAVIVLYKFPAILADLAVGLLIYKLVLHKSERLALISAAAYIFNPAIIASSALWGQVDGLIPLFVLLALFLLERNTTLSALALSFGILVKPLTAFAAPLVALLLWKKRGLVSLLRYVFVSAVFFAAGFLPFAGGSNVFPFIIDRISLSAGQYPYTSVNAFNFWGIASGFWIPDDKFWVVGVLLTGLLFIISLVSFIKRTEQKKVYLVLSILFLSSFLFLTRVHERHLLPVFAPLAVSAGASVLLWGLYAVLSLAHIANLFYSHVWITQGFREVFPGNVASLFSGLNIAVLLVMISRLKKRW